MCRRFFYTGSTKNLELRLEQHQNGEGANHTKKYLPVKFVYVEIFDRIDNAFNREKQINLHYSYFSMNFSDHVG
jgi:putative endonuclease